MGHHKITTKTELLFAIDAGWASLTDALSQLKANDNYTYRVQWSEDDEEYVGLCAEFPSLSWLAATP